MHQRPKELILTGISSKILMLRNMYTDISCRIKLKVFFVKRISLLINDLACLLEKQRIGILSIGDVFIYILEYADDMLLLSDNESDLEKMISKLELVCRQSQMVVDIPKTKWPVFEKRSCNLSANIPHVFRR